MTSSQLVDIGFEQEPNLGWRRFAGPKATAQTVGLPILLFLSLNAAPAGLTQSPEVRLIQLRILFFALFSSWAYFTALGLIINKIASRVGGLRTVLILFLFASTEVLRTVLVHEFALLSGLKSEALWLFRISAGAMTGIIFFSILSVVVNDSQYYRSAYRRLFEQRLRLSASLQDSENTLISTRNQLIQGIRDQLTAALHSSLRKTETPSPRTTEISNELFRVAEEVVRPLSHELFDIPVIVKQSELKVSAPRVPVKQILIDTTIAEPFRPYQLIFIGLMMTIPLTSYFTNIMDFVNWAISLVFMFVVVSLAKRYLTQVVRNIAFGWRVVLMSSVYLLPSIFFAVTLMPAVMDKSSDRLTNFFYGYAIVLILSWLLAASSGMRLSRQRMLDDITEVNEQLYWLGVRLQAELWVDQKNLALTLHNDVQATLLAAALKLKAASDSGNTSEEVLGEVRKLISRGMNFSTAETVSKTLEDAISRLNENWGGLITMQYSATQETLDILARDAVTRGVLEDILSEFQNNSLKHGKATETTAILTMPEVDILQVALTNNGNKIVDSDVVAGLGSVFLKSVSLSYKLENFSRGVKLTVKLPLSDVASVA
ncbi:hypothetical protein [Aurantimicrobium minutum]|uniref:hypothetical protein n=1 Tax=Aurantimicrobium minutum TaxID=708131 RepID=UPI002473D9C2|nr:hypothetical protein [Aurantimicrobium minutum]MDH6422493.1 signal transduction histidine kinase [Aurantimicrobium minutum]